MKIKLMIFTIIMSLMCTPLLAFADTSIDSKAKALNKLTILQGDGINFNLKGQLKRSEAIAFIIRVMGKESFVKDNQLKYQNTAFSDVKSTDWFAASVGFCVEQNIVAGFPDGKFHPNDSISEKAFIKLLLNTMGYQSSTDFTWDNVFSFAFSKGFDSKYQYQTKDDTNYIRSDVFNVLYNSLTIPGKNSSSIIDNLLSDKVIERKTVLQLGLIKDTIATSITSTNSMSETSLIINLNEGAENLGISNIIIYETGNKQNILTANIEKKDDKKITLKTAIQKADQSYTVEVTNIVNKDNLTYPNLISEFSGFVQTKISNVNVMSESSIILSFNKSVKTIPTSAILVYEKDNNTNILTTSVESQTDKSIILKTSSQKPGQIYIITISGVDDGLGSLLTLNTDFLGYKISEITSDFFKISKVIPISSNVLNIYFTQPINGIAALPIYYEIFKDNVSYIKGTFSNMVGKQSPTERNMISLYLRDRPINVNASYKVVVSGELSSYDGVLLKDGLGDSAVFTSNMNPIAGLSATTINAVDNNTLRIEFNKEIDPTSVQQLNNYVISSNNGVSTNVIRAIIPNDANGKAILLQIAGTFDGNTIYTLSIKNIADNFGINLLPEAKLPFIGRGLSAHKDLKVLFVRALDKLTLQVYFDRSLNDTAAQTTSYYSISGITDGSYSTIASKAYYDPNNSKIVIISLPAGKEVISSNSYKLTVSNQMTDELISISNANSEFTFSGSNDSNVKPFITEAKIIGKNIIRVKSQKALLASGSNVLASNYTLEFKDVNNVITTVNPTYVSAIDGYTLVMNFWSLDITKMYTLKFTTLTDYSGLNLRTAIDGSTSIGVTVGK